MPTITHNRRLAFKILDIADTTVRFRVLIMFNSFNSTFLIKARKTFILFYNTQARVTTLMYFRTGFFSHFLTLFFVTNIIEALNSQVACISFFQGFLTIPALPKLNLKLLSFFKLIILFAVFAQVIRD